MSHPCGLKSCLKCSTKLLSASSDSDSSKTNNIGLNVGPSNCNLQPPLALWMLPSSAREISQEPVPESRHRRWLKSSLMLQVQQDLCGDRPNQHCVNSSGEVWRVMDVHL